jgi:hypothetical protein
VEPVESLNQPRIADRTELKRLLRGPKVAEELERQQGAFEELMADPKKILSLQDLRRRFGAPS